MRWVGLEARRREEEGVWVSGEKARGKETTRKTIAEVSG
jgi:hypothetical protein